MDDNRGWREAGTEVGGEWLRVVEMTTETAKEYQCQIMHFSGMK